MADNDVKINISTTADNKGAKDAEKGLEQVEKQAVETTQATKKIGENTASLSGLRRKVQELEQELEKAEIGSQEYDRALDDLAATNNKLSNATAKTAAALREKEKAHGAASKSTADAGRATLEFSRAVEDAQYGIAGVLNNLPGLVSMLGGSAGLAGVISLAAVGVTLLVKQLGAFGETAEEKTKRLDALAESMGFLNKAVDDFIAKKVEAKFADQDALTEALAISTDGLTASMQRKIEAIKSEISGMGQVMTATRARIDAEIELKRALDPEFDEAAAAAEKAALKQEELNGSILLANAEKELRLEENRLKQTQAQAEYDAVRQDLDDTRNDLRKAQEEYARVSVFRLDPRLADPKVQQELENFKPGLFTSADEVANKARDLGKIRAAENFPKENRRATELDKIIPELEKRIAEAERGLDSKDAAFAGAIDALIAERDAIIAAGERESAALAQKAQELGASQAAEKLRTSAADMEKEVGELQKAVEESVKPEKAAELKGITQEIAQATSDGVVTAEELKKVQELWRDLTPKLAGLGHEVSAQIAEVVSSINTTSSAQKEAAAKLQKTITENGSSVIEVQQKTTAILQQQKARMDAMTQQINQLQSR